MNKNYHLIIHATNITGLGASKVVISFINSFIKVYPLLNKKIILPDCGPLSTYTNVEEDIIRYKRVVPNSISRFFECFFSPLFFNKDYLYIILGDIPLYGIHNQIVLVHQSNLISPDFNPESGNSLVFKLNRYLFKRNLPYVKKIIVQSKIMEQGLLDSYPEIANRISIVPQPIPDDYINSKKSSHKFGSNTCVVLFYPSAGYPHKNHEFLFKLNANVNFNKDDYKILLTLTDTEFDKYRSLGFVENLGRLSSQQMIEYYNKCDSLLFLSKAESFGLPLLEAMKLNIPIVTIDLPYAKWMCEDTAFYFLPDHTESFIEALNNLKLFLKSNIEINYDKPLEKIPSSWKIVVKEFYNALIV